MQEQHSDAVRVDELPSPDVGATWVIKRLYAATSKRCLRERHAMAYGDVPIVVDSLEYYLPHQPEQMWKVVCAVS